MASDTKMIEKKSKKVLEVRKLTKHFGGLAALNDVDLDVSESEILGIIGPNGAGKSTLFNIIAGFFPPTSGTVMFKGKELTGLRADQVAHQGIGRTFQASTLFKQFTVFDNVFNAFHMHYRQPPWKALLHTRAVRQEEGTMKQKAMEILNFTGLASQKDKLAENLSSGYQKILAISIALATNPKLLLLDEPVTTLSPHMVEAVMGLVTKVRDTGTTVLIIEHNMKAIMDYCDRIAVLAYGSKIAEGLPREIGENKEVVEAYLGVMG
ncbi:MAG: ABC transporter ATP-binding protein [Desulfobacterales bacterium]|nr:MAG: ABC transporter ATP-binding protein [Desulfobacterales bacterium]